MDEREMCDGNSYMLKIICGSHASCIIFDCTYIKLDSRAQLSYENVICFYLLQCVKMSRAHI